MTVLAVTEHRRGELRDVSFELITAGRDLADELGTDLHLVVIGGDVEAFAEKLNRNGDHDRNPDCDDDMDNSTEKPN